MSADAFETNLPRIAGVILAGGAGHRLGGVVKANIKVGGVRLLDRAAAALRPASPLIVSIGSHDEMDLPAGVVAVRDTPHPVRGPLAGLLAACQWLRTCPDAPELFVSMAVDTPFFPADFALKALPFVGDDRAAVVGSFEGQAYPTNVLWRRAAVENALLQFGPKELAAGGIKALLGHLEAHVLQWPTGPFGNPFSNVNTPEELEVLNALATG